MRVIRTADIMGAAMEAYGSDGLSFGCSNDNWDSMELAEINEALIGAGVAPIDDPTAVTASVKEAAAPVIATRRRFTAGASRR